MHWAQSNMGAGNKEKEYTLFIYTIDTVTVQSW